MEWSAASAASRSAAMTAGCASNAAFTELTNPNTTASAAAEGVRQGLTDIVEQTRKRISSTGKDVKEFAVEDLVQTKEDMEAVADLFVATLRKVADSSGEAAKDILHELADDAKKVGSTLREKAVAASHAVAERLIDMGSEAAQKTGEVSDKAVHTLGKETKELSERMVDVAKGAAIGMWQGARTAFRKDEHKDDKS